MFLFPALNLYQDSALLGIEHVENTDFVDRVGIYIDEIGVLFLIGAHKLVRGNFFSVYGYDRKAGRFHVQVVIELFAGFAEGNLRVRRRPAAVIFQERDGVETDDFALCLADFYLDHIGIVYRARLFIGEIERDLRSALVYPYGRHIFIAEARKIFFRNRLGAFEVEILFGAIFIEIEGY